MTKSRRARARSTAARSSAATRPGRRKFSQARSPAWCLGAGQHVLEHGHLGEGAGDLEGPPDAAGDALRSGPSRVTSAAPMRISPRGRAEGAGDEVEERGLAGAVRADQPDHLAARRGRSTCRRPPRRPPNCFTRSRPAMSGGLAARPASARIWLFGCQGARSRLESLDLLASILTDGITRVRPGRGGTDGPKRDGRSGGRQLRALRPPGRGGRARGRADLLRREAGRLFRAAGARCSSCRRGRGSRSTRSPRCCRSSPPSSARPTPTTG